MYVIFCEFVELVVSINNRMFPDNQIIWKQKPLINIGFFPKSAPRHFLRNLFQKISAFQASIVLYPTNIT